MRTDNRRWGRSVHVRGGYGGLLMMLVVLAIGLIIYYMSVMRVEQATKAMQSSMPKQYPWMQENRIKDAMTETIEEPLPEQLHVAEAMEVVAEVMEEDQRRGKLKLVLYPDGRVAGYWAGRFFPPGVNEHEVMGADVRGNIDPSKVYEDENGEDASKLYFLTKGDFLILETRTDNRMRRVHGEIFVQGWFNKDVEAQGELHLTSNRKKQVIYTWRSGPGKPMREAIFGP